MGEKSTIIHCNSTLTHQTELASRLREGFAAHDIRAQISNKPNTPADIHVVLGPWFALANWKHANTLYIDRAYWGDPDCVSISWLKGGEKTFLKNMPNRKHPKLEPMKTGGRRIYLCDYGRGPEGQYDAVRYHPAEHKEQRPLTDDLQAHDIAIGRRSTALVDAAIHGLMVECNDPHSPVYGITDRKQWITDLAWHNWSKTEIASGVFLNGIGHNSSTH